MAWAAFFQTVSDFTSGSRIQSLTAVRARSSRLSTPERVDDARGGSDTALMACAPLRNLAVAVVESSPGTFHWKLTEDLVVDLDASIDDFSSWAAALDAGVDAMKSLCGRPDRWAARCRRFEPEALRPCATATSLPRKPRSNSFGT